MLSSVSRPLIKRCISSSGIPGELPIDLDVATRIVFAKKFSDELKEFNKGQKYDMSDGLVLLKKYLETVPAKTLQKKLKSKQLLWVPVAESLYLFDDTS